MKTDPIKLEIYKNRFQTVAEEMGAALQRTAFSPNIKERRDFSCALFDGKGELVSQAEHIPVHLGAMPLSVANVVSDLDLGPGDTAILNDPFRGGTHLPDITLVRPLFLEGRTKPSFYIANRAHHSDVGGMMPGSMPLSTEIFQEGLRIPPIYFERNGEIDRSVLKLLLANVRTPQEREGDLLAQYMSAKVGEKRILEMVEAFGEKELLVYIDELKNYSERMIRTVVENIPDGSYSFEDFMDNDGQSDRPIKIVVKVTIKGSDAHIDFTGSDKQVPGCVNSVYAITLSVVFYVFRILVDRQIPSNAGCMLPISIIAPEGTVVNAKYPAAVSGGNVETSQRTVDVLLGALAQAIPDKIPAASGGSMNNLTIGGTKPDTGEAFAYYETIACGMGARSNKPGTHAVHTHMTNTLNTPVEALENELPILINEYSIRRKSGGRGKHNGGSGVKKSIEFLTDMQLSIISERRTFSPYGLQGGQSGKPGRNTIIHGSKITKLNSKCNISVKKGEIFTIETPGGGGYGEPSVKPTFR